MRHPAPSTRGARRPLRIRGLSAALLLAAGILAASAAPSIRSSYPDGTPQAPESGSSGGSSGGASTAHADCPEPCPTLYVVGTAHLDTQWLWTIQDTIREYIPNTLHDNFALFEKYPGYVFSFEGAFRYMLAKEYDPRGYARLKDYVRRGRWRVAGSAVDAGDVNIPSPESLIRHVLYGNGFFRQEFGKTSADIYLPDCFGFGWALPTVAAHCGLRGFSTQKLTWGSSVGVPFDIGLWEGVDGSALIAELAPGDYVSKINEDLSASAAWRERIDKLGSVSDAYVGYRYFGTGDQGGAPDAESVAWLEKSLAGRGPVRVLSTGSDQLARDLPPDRIARLARYRGELLMTRHGTGCYTSQTVMKRWNRRNEQLAAAAEAASVVADWLGGASYPKETLRDAWVRFLWHHHHDDVTGTSTPLAYPFSYNDEVLSMKDFAAVLADAAGAAARTLDTRARGVPLVVFNPLAVDREDVVEADVRLPAAEAETGAGALAVRVFDPDGREVPSQTAGAEEGQVHVLFLAKAPSMGFAVYDVRTDRRAALGSGGATGGLRVSETEIENARYRVRVENGDIAAIYDKRAGRDVLSGPTGLALFKVAPGPWPEWEIHWGDLTNGARGRVGTPAAARVVERGPARAAIEVSRAFEGSWITQRIRLAAGDAGDRVEVDSRIDWNTPATLLKAELPLAASNPKATYDIGVGSIQRGNDTETLYEVPAQKWADITAPDGSYGVSILDDSKYGWDKPSDGVLRLTLVHSPPNIWKEYGRHRFLYAIAGHRGDWREGRIPALGARLNQPLVAFQAPPHAGTLGKRFSMLRVSAPQVAVSALKMEEEGREVIVRLFEQHGTPVKDARLSMGARILAAREVTGAERPLGESLALGAAETNGGGTGASARPGDGPERAPGTAETMRPSDAAQTRPGGGSPESRARRHAARARAAAAPQVVDGDLVFSMEPFRPRTFALRLAPPPARVPPPSSAQVPLDFDVDVVSPHEAVRDGDFDGEGHALPAELLPRAILSDGVRFVLGPTTRGAKNALTCRGQSLEFEPRGARRVMLLAAARGADTSGVFTIGERSWTLPVPSFTGFVGQSQTLVVDGRIVDAAHMEEPFIKPSRVAWIGTHRHTASGGVDPYVFCYLFSLGLPLTPQEASGRVRLTLPDNENIRVMAVTLVTNPNDDTVPASELVERTSGTRIRPKGGLSIGPAEVTLASDRPDAVLHYTINGGEPTLDDPLYRGPFTIERDATVRARAFFGDRGEDDVAVRRFSFARPREALRPGKTAPGLVYEVFEGSWSDLSGIAGAKSVRKGTASTIDATPRTRETNFGLRFRGYIDCPREGVYTFSTSSDDGSSLRIGDVLVVDNDGLHGSREVSGQIALAAGRHAIEVLFFQRGGDIELGVAWEGPGISPAPIPAKALSH